MLEVLEKFGFTYLEYDGLGTHVWGLRVTRQLEIVVMLCNKGICIYREVGRKMELIGTPVDAVSMERVIQGIKSGTLRRVNRGD